MKKIEILELLERYKNGSTKAYNVLHKEIEKSVNKAINKYCLTNPKLSQIKKDLKQDILVKILLSLPKYENNVNCEFGTWVFVISKNYIIDSYRKQKRYHVISMDQTVNNDNDELDLKNSITFEAKELNAEKEIVVSERIQEIYDCLEEIKKPATKELFKKVFELRYVQGMKFDRVAKILDINENTARGVAAKIKKQMAKLKTLI